MRLSTTGDLITGCAASGVKLARTSRRLYSGTSENDIVLQNGNRKQTLQGSESEISESDLIIVVMKVL